MCIPGACDAASGAVKARECLCAVVEEDQAAAGAAHRRQTAARKVRAATSLAAMEGATAAVPTFWCSQDRGR